MIRVSTGNGHGKDEPFPVGDGGALFEAWVSTLEARSPRLEALGSVLVVLVPSRGSIAGNNLGGSIATT